MSRAEHGLETSYEQALTGLHARIPDRLGAPEPDRMRALAELLGDPQRSYPSVHITGTNGKTSVARMLTALFGALGLKAGTYTSPHLQEVRERLAVAGQPVDREDFAAAYAAVSPLAELIDDDRPGRDGGPVTYFELLTGMAYWWFADCPVEVGVFEVGMGGVWDATNLVRGEVAVITRIDRDHPLLGSTVEEIAREKAGIIKPGATVVSANQPPAALAVIRRAAAEQNARLLLAGQDFDVVSRQLAVGGQMLAVDTPTRTVDELLLRLHGAHQADNAALALAGLDAFLGGLDAVEDDVLREAVAAVEAPGRLEVVDRNPTVVLDGAHNPAGAARAATAVADDFAFRDVILVAGCLADKDVHGILSAFADLASHVVVTQPPSDRATALRAMHQIAQDVWSTTGVVVEAVEEVPDAVDAATGVAGPADGVVVTGSLVTVGAARDRYRGVDAPDAPDPHRG